MGSLLSRMAEKPTTCSNRRSSHAHSYCTQFSEALHLCVAIEPQVVEAAASAPPQPGGRTAGLRRREDTSCAAMAGSRSAGRIQLGRFSAGQPMVSRGGAERLMLSTGVVGADASRASGFAQSHVCQSRRFVGRERQVSPPFGTCGLVSRPQREYQKQTEVQECLLLSDCDSAHRSDGGHSRSAAVPARKNGATSQPSAPGWATHSLSQQEQPGQRHLEALRPLLHASWDICVQFDSWYASEKLIKHVRRQGWHVTCGLKHNRQLNGKRLDQIASALRHRRYQKVQVTAADGNKTSYFVRQTSGRLK